MSTAPLSNVSPMASPSAKQLRHRFAATVAAIWRAASGANSIAVPRALIRLLGGDIKAAVMLSQAVVWQREALDTQPRDHGWFYRSAADWHAATRLTPREQERIRRKLVSLGFLQVERNGYPATLQFYPDVPAMAAAIGCREQELFPRPRHGEPLAPTTDVRQVDRSVSLLGRIIYLPELMDVCEQNAGATLLLCHLLGLHFWHNVTYGQAVYWFTSSAAELEFATGLPEKAQLLARRVLQRQQMILERRLRPEAPLEYQLYLRGVLAAFIRAGGSIGSPAALPVAELDPPRVVDQVGQPTRRPGSSIRVGRYVANGAGKSAARIVGAFDQLERAELDPILTAAPLTAGTRPSSPDTLQQPRWIGPSISVRLDGTSISGRFDLLSHLRLQAAGQQTVTTNRRNVDDVNADHGTASKANMDTALSGFAHACADSDALRTDSQNAPVLTPSSEVSAGSHAEDRPADNPPVSTIPRDLYREQLFVSVEPSKTTTTDSDTEQARERAVAVLANNETPIQLASTRPQPIDLNSLVWPPCLAHRQEHRSARNAVHDLARGLPHAAFQAVLDEMTFINRTKSIKSPVGLARTLLSCVRNGTFSPNGADLVLEQRQQAQRNAADRAKQHEHWKRAALQKATAPSQSPDQSRSQAGAWLDALPPALQQAVRERRQRSSSTGPTSLQSDHTAPLHGAPR